MFRKRKAFTGDGKQTITTRYYLRVGRRDVSLRMLGCLLFVAALLILMITVKPGLLLPVKL